MSTAIIHQVARAMDRIAPLSLAESWDNVGVLLEAVRPLTSRRVLLTIDLTPQVLDSILPYPPSAIISYHPPIFSGLKSMSTSVPLQRTLLSLAREGVSVYSPHTSLDNTREGVNWWLGKAFDGLGGRWEGWASGGGAVSLDRPARLGDVVEAVKGHLGIRHLNVGSLTSEPPIRTIALCAGSGGSSLQTQGKDADCWLTGEMSHHEVLAAVAMGKTVLLCGHTNTERGYLTVLREKLLVELENEHGDGEGRWEVEISQADAHPLRLH